MTDFFNEEIVEQSGNEIFEESTKEDVDDIFSDVGIRLAQLGIDPNKARLFSKRHPNRNVLNVKTNLPNKLFFQYVLDSCDAKQLSYIEHKKLSPGLFKMWEDAEPVEIGTIDDEEVEDDPVGELATIEQYIERNAELIKQLANAKEVAQKYVILNQEGKEHLLRYKKDNDILCKQLAFLYTLMSNKMDFIVDIDITDNEVSMVEDIKELITNGLT